MKYIKPLSLSRAENLSDAYYMPANRKYSANIWFYPKGTVMTNILTVVFIGLCVFAFIKILSAPIKGILKFILNMITGFLLLLAAEFICGFFDFSVGISYLNCLVAGVLGIPGVILLILLKILF